MSEILLQFKKLNWLLVFLISFLSFVGLVMIYSATYGGDDRIFISHFSKICLGLSIMIVVSLITEAPDSATQKMVDDVRVPSGKTILGKQH